MDSETYWWVNLVVGLTLLPLRGLFVMLTLGVLHHNWSPQIPALGFWPSVLLVLGLQAILRGDRPK